VKIPPRPPITGFVRSARLLLPAPTAAAAGAGYVAGRRRTAEIPGGEDELRAAEERFRAVTGSTRDGIISADRSGRIMFWNAGAAAIFGHSEDEALGRPLTDLMPERYRDAHLAGMSRYLATGEARMVGSSVELEGLRADGAEFPLELSLGTWNQGGAVCFSAVVRDLIDRVRTRRALREAEERFAGAFEGAAVGMVLATPDGIVLRANRALCELTGLAEDQLAGRRLDEFVHPDERTADITAIRAMLAGRTERLATERRMLGAGGRTRIARVNLSLIRETDGTPLHFVGQVEDVNCYVVKPLDLDDFTALVQAINRFWFEVARLPPR